MGLRERMQERAGIRTNGKDARPGLDPANARAEYERQEREQKTGGLRASLRQRQVNAPEVTDNPEEQRDMSIEQGQRQGHGSSGRETLTQGQVLEALDRGERKFSAKKGGDLPQAHGKTLMTLLKAGKIAGYEKEGDVYVVKCDGEERSTPLPPTEIDRGRVSSTRPNVQSLPREKTETLDRSDAWIRIFEAITRNDDSFGEKVLDHHEKAWKRFLSDMQSA